MDKMNSRITRCTQITRRTLCQVIASGLPALAPKLLQASAGNEPPGWVEIETTLIDHDATPFGTFQSHNQNIVANRNGVFLTYIRSRNEDYTAQHWRLMRSTDGGRTFSVVYEATDTTSAPAMETDEQDNLYLYRPNWVTGRGYLYRFLDDNDYRSPIVTDFDLKSASGKYSMMYDGRRKTLYVAQNPFWFVALSTEGKVLRKTKLWSRGERASLEYPQLSLAADGTIHVAWTTNVHGKYWYRSIHHMQSPDAGANWRRMDGAPLQPPVTPDDPAVAQQISQANENDDHTWLANFATKQGKVHFSYATLEVENSKLKTMTYLRYDTSTGRRDVQHTPEFRGEKIALNKSSGFFATNATKDSPLFCVMADNDRIACLASVDHGRTWTDHARDETKYAGAYAISGCRDTSGGYILGSFTDRQQPGGDPLQQSAVYFFRIKANAQID